MAQPASASVSAVAEVSDCLMMYGELDPVYSLEVTKYWFAQGCYNGLLMLRDLEQAEVKHSLAAHSGYIRALTIAPDIGGAATSEALLSASQDGTIKVWDVETAKQLHTYTGHNCAVDCVGTTPNNGTPLVVSGDVQGCVAVWGGGAGPGGNALKRKMRCHIGRILGLCAMDDGKRVATCSDDGIVKLIDTETAKVLAHYNVLSPQMCLASIEETGTLLSGGSDSRVYSFDVRTSVPYGVYTGGHSNVVVGVGHNGGRVYSVADDGVACQWDRGTGRLEHSYQGHTKGISSMKITKDGHLFTGSFDGTVRMWDNQGVVHRLQQKALLVDQEAKLKKKEPKVAKPEGKEKKKK
eukprot:PhF_6_TR8469/c0_g1_i3/m.13233